MSIYRDFTRHLLLRETADLVLARTKRVTRRLAQVTADPDEPPWRPGAYSKLYRRHPRAGGKPFGIAKIDSCTLERLGDITPSEVALEGFLNLRPLTAVEWFIELFCKINNIPLTYQRRDHVALARQRRVWRVRFTLAEVLR